MAFEYKLEYVYQDETPADASVYIQMKRNTPIYQGRIAKEDYDILEDEEKNEFLTELFNIAGVVEISTQAYRIWVMKSPVFNWSDVLLPMLTYLTEYYGEDGYSDLPGSANPDGTGFTLESMNSRRPV